MNNQSLKHILDELLSKKSKLNSNFSNYTVEQVWRKTFGDVISSYTSNVRIRNGILIVYLTSSALKQEILATKPKVIERMNGQLKYNQVTDIQLR